MQARISVEVVDPPAYTPPYDRALCAALARAGAEVELVTSRFEHGPVPPADGFAVSESFYRRAAARPRSRWRRPLRAAEHLGDMLSYRRRGGRADVVHLQWLTLPALDAYLLPPRRPRLLTPHGWLREEGIGAARGSLRRLVDRVDAVVALSDYGAERIRTELGIGAERVHVIPHGAFDYLTKLPDPAPLPTELGHAAGPVVLAFGLIRPYKGTDVLIDAFGALAREHPEAELWVVGRPLGVDLEQLRRRAQRRPGRVRFLPRFVPDNELPAIFERADVVALPYRDAEQSGVLFTALAFAKPIVLSDVGGFGEVAATGAARLVPPGDAEALAGALAGLLGSGAERGALASAARAVVEGPYSWDAIAARTLALYERLLR